MQKPLTVKFRKLSTAPVTGLGSIHTVTVRLLTPLLRETFASLMLTLATSLVIPYCMIFLFMQNLVRRLPLLAQQVLVKQPLLTCSTASMTLKMARFATTASTLTKLERALFVVLSVLFCKTSTSLRVPSWITSATAVLMLLMRTA